MSNVDIFHTFDETNDVYRLGAEALGREFSFFQEQAKSDAEALALMKKVIS